MPVTRWAISLEKSLAKAIKRSAAGEPISAWLADAARRKLRSKELLVSVAAWEKEHGKITDAEADAAWGEYQQALQAHRTGKKKRRR